MNGNYSPPLSDSSSLDLEKPILPQDPSIFSIMDEITPATPLSQSSQQQPQRTQTQNQPAQAVHPDHNTPVSAKAQNLMMQYHDYTQHNNTAAPPVADDGHHYFDCPKVWERIVMHPRFEEVDIEALCAELNTKVRIVIPPPQAIYPPPPAPLLFCLWPTTIAIISRPS